MSKNKKSKAVSIRSSAAEYLTFIAASGEGGIEAIYADENVWLTQKMMATLYNKDVRTISDHIQKIMSDSELDDSVIRNFRITADDGKNYDTKHYNLKMIIAVGYKTNSDRAVQFRKWATNIVEEFTIKGYTMDDERLKNDGSILTKKYFEEQLERIREIRLSERKFHQKITDIYATSLDYDAGAFITKEFFAKVQNKLHWAIHGQTAAEVIYDRANAEKDNMGLTSWEGAPKSKIHKYDVAIAKNYLTDDELHSMRLLVSAYLDLAENRAKRHIPMTMEDWAKHLDLILQADGRELLTHAGSISAEIAKTRAESEFEKYRIIQDRLFESDFDILLRLDELESKVLSKGKRDGKEDDE